mmetsp:Transcript_9126/g.28542  ORF Transcript_9126/g.28542 Transcript_9126/m.28542 type:complete len:253 (-) Transcript_9126:626-1384(-)
MKSAVPAAPIIPPSAQASASTMMGSTTSFMPSTTVAMAVSRSRIFCLSNNANAAAQPSVEPQSNANTELPAASACITVATLPGVAAATARRPSITIPPSVAATIVPNGTSALAARSGVPGEGSMGPRSGAGPSSFTAAAGAASLATTASRMGPKSRPDATVAATNARSAIGKKRYGSVPSVSTKGDGRPADLGTPAVAVDTMPTCWPIHDDTGDDADTQTATKWSNPANFSRQTPSAGSNGRKLLPTIKIDA